MREFRGETSTLCRGVSRKMLFTIVLQRGPPYFFRARLVCEFLGQISIGCKLCVVEETYFHFAILLLFLILRFLLSIVTHFKIILHVPGIWGRLGMHVVMRCNFVHVRFVSEEFRSRHQGIPTKKERPWCTSPGKSDRSRISKRR